MSKRPRPRRPALEELEPRLLHSADPLSASVSSIAGELEDASSSIVEYVDGSGPLEVELISGATHPSGGSDRPYAGEEVRLELVFVDTGVEGYEQLLTDLEGADPVERFLEIVLLDHQRDGVDQISESLREHADVDAVHILSHGSETGLQLGNTWLSGDNVREYDEQLTSWADQLGSDADLLIYGCNLAAGPDGVALIERIANLTGADVTASEDVTVSELLGGDWDLEFQIGDIESGIVLNANDTAFDSVLAAFTVDTLADTVDVIPGNGLAEDAAGDTSLRAAIEESNALGGADSISLGAGTHSLGLGEITISSDLTITGAGVGVTFIDGGTLDRIFSVTSGTVTISGVTMQGGDVRFSADGGAIDISSGADVTLTNVDLSGNAADRGGAINNAGTLTLNDVTLDSNQSEINGGALANSGTAILNRVTISHNSSGGDGGGIESSGGGSSVSLTNVTISSNRADVNGGGLNVQTTATLQNVTITSNTATQAGGIQESGGTITITNTIIAENVDTDDGNGPDIAGSFTSGGNNLIGDIGGANGFTDGVNGDQVGSGGSPIDPLLGGLANNGGPTLTHALITGSSAIDAGSNAGAPSTDQQGNTRDATVDIGAFEYGVAGPNVAPTATPDPGAFSTFLQSQSPLNYWRLNETSGTSATDEGTAGNSGTYQGVSLGEAGAINGDSNGAVRFDGSTYLEIPHTNDYLLDNGTVQLWFNADNPATGNLQGLFSKDSNNFDTGGHLTIYLNDFGQVEVRLQSTTSSYLVTSPASVTAGQYHNVAVTFGSAGMALYLDGELVDSNNYVGGLGTTSGGTGNFEPIAIGASTINSDDLLVTPVNNFFTGLIDEVAILSNQLDAGTIHSLYAAAVQDYTVQQDGTLVIPVAEGVLVNDFDPEGDPLTAVLVSGPSKAQAFTLNPDGSFSYTPLASFNGVDTFTYMANDSFADSNVTTVTISVTPIADALWLSTQDDVVAGGTPGIDTWTAGEAISFGGPGLGLEPTGTAGTFASQLNLNASL